MRSPRLRRPRSPGVRYLGRPRGVDLPPRWPSAKLAGAIVMSLLAVGACRCWAAATALLDDVTFPGRFQADPWNKAPGLMAPGGEAPAGGPEAASLRVTIDWPAGDEFRFFSLQPSASRGPVPYRLQEVALWAKPAGDGRFLEVHFRDADGQDQKVGWGPLTTTDWQRLAQPIPPEWKQPLALTGLTWHNWGVKGPGPGATTLLAADMRLLQDDMVTRLPNSRAHKKAAPSRALGRGAECSRSPYFGSLNWR